MTVLGAIACGLALLGVVFRRGTLTASALGFAAGVPSSAGIIAVQPVPIFVCVGAVAAVGLLVEGPRRRAHRTPGTSLLVAFLAWALAMTAIGPWAFAGLPVLTPRGGVERQLSSLTPLSYTTTNIAQALILVTACAAVAYLLRTGTAHVALLVALVTGVGLSLVRSLMRVAGADVLAPLIDTLQTYYATTDGRWRGVFNEPSEMAAFVLGALASSTVAACTAASRRLRVLYAVLAVAAGVLLVGSASGTAVLASVVVASGAGVAIVVSYLRSGGRGTAWFVLGGLVVVSFLIGLGDSLADGVRQIVQGKIGSQSQVARTGADGVALRIVGDTWGLGVGLGSSRASSFVANLASTVGVIGTVLFGATVAMVLRTASRHRLLLSSVVGLLALLVAKAVATPDLGTPLLWLLVASCAAPPGRTDDMGTNLELEPECGLEPRTVSR